MYLKKTIRKQNQIKPRFGPMGFGLPSSVLRRTGTRKCESQSCTMKPSVYYNDIPCASFHREQHGNKQGLVSAGGCYEESFIRVTPAMFI